MSDLVSEPLCIAAHWGSVSCPLSPNPPNLPHLAGGSPLRDADRLLLGPQLHNQDEFNPSADCFFGGAEQEALSVHNGVPAPSLLGME